MNHYTIRKFTKTGEVKELKSIDSPTDFVARRIGSLLSAQKQHRDEKIYIVDDINNHSIIYLNGFRIREFHNNKIIY